MIYHRKVTSIVYNWDYMRRCWLVDEYMLCEFSTMVIIQDVMHWSPSEWGTSHWLLPKCAIISSHGWATLQTQDLGVTKNNVVSITNLHQFPHGNQDRHKSAVARRHKVSQGSDVESLSKHLMKIPSESFGYLVRVLVAGGKGSGKCLSTPWSWSFVWTNCSSQYINKSPWTH